MNMRVQNAVSGRLSLRPPQAESLLKLVRALEAAPSLLGHDQDVAAILATLKSEFPTLEDFEREFPSLCFSLATGVGKTRLMGAFIAYLHLAHEINNFFVLAPNLTIYNKLIADFTRNTPKYVFKGITMSREAGIREQRFEDYIVKKLIDFDDVDYFTQAELLYDLAGQAVAHYQAQNYSENELHEVFDTYGAELARLIRAEMMAHFWEEATEYEVQVSRGFTELKACNYTAVAGQTAHHHRETVTELGKIKQMLFGGFSRCLYPLQKFDSDTERRFAVILERDASKWFKPAKGQFQIYYKLGSEQPEYIPDFVAEVDTKIFMIETKARGDIDTQEVQVKAAAAARWCRHASVHAASVGGKPWRYLLVPHDDIAESKRLSDFLRFEATDQHSS